MTKILSPTTFVAAVVATVAIVSGSAALSRQGHGGALSAGKQSQGGMSRHQQGMMDRTAMNLEPHHLLAMAYRDNLVNFANALLQEAEAATTVSPEFARAAVAEMKRDFDQMQQHHRDHLAAMGDATKRSMDGTIRRMDTRHSDILRHLAALDLESRAAAPDSETVSEHVTAILDRCEGIATMPDGLDDLAPE